MATERGDEVSATTERETTLNDWTRRREALGLSKSELARRAGLSRPTIIRLERDDPRIVPQTREAVNRTLEEAENERREQADELGLQAYNGMARAVNRLEDLRESGAISPGGVVLCIRSLANAYGERVEEIDDQAVEEAIRYARAVLQGRIQMRAERN